MLAKQYGKEAFDLQLCIIWFLRKIWIVFIAGLFGGLIFFGIYTLKNITFGADQKYEIVSELYLEYAIDELGEEYTVFNQTTWENMIYSDDIMEPCLLELTMTRAEVKQSVSATLLSDVRILTTTVEGYQKQEVEKINQALLLSLEKFGENQREFIRIRPMLAPTDATLQKQDIRLFNATVLGIVVGVFISIFLLFLFFVWDDRLYFSDVFERRYQIPMLGNYGTALCQEQAKCVLNEKIKYSLIFIDQQMQLQSENSEELWKNIVGSKNSECLNPDIRNNPIWDAKQIEKISNTKSNILLVSAKRHNSKLIETTLQLLEKNQCEVVAAVLIESNVKLQNMYYFPGMKWMKKHLK